jgi:hypothetical protein
VSKKKRIARCRFFLSASGSRVVAQASRLVQLITTTPHLSLYTSLATEHSFSPYLTQPVTLSRPKHYRNKLNTRERKTNEE